MTFGIKGPLLFSSLSIAALFIDHILKAQGAIFATGTLVAAIYAVAVSAPKR